MNHDDLTSLGEKARATALSKYEKSEIGTKAAKARWQKAKYRKQHGFTIPIDSGYVWIPEMSEEEFEFLLETLKLWRKRITKPPEQSIPTPEDPPI